MRTFRQRIQNGRPCRAFTLLELLVVVGIIVVLLGLLVPVLRGVRDRASAAACMNNQRQLMNGFLAFAADHDGHLPGNCYDGNNPDPDKRAWVLNAGEPYTDAPQKGTLFRYVGGNAEVYLCPSQRKLNTHAGAESRFHYTAFLCFSGAHTSKVPPLARLTYSDGRAVEYPTPVICEEEPQGPINGGILEGGHTNVDQISHHHGGGGYYVSIDGSAHFIVEPWDRSARNWDARGPKGAFVSMGQFNTWGWWEGQ